MAKKTKPTFADKFLQYVNNHPAHQTSLIENGLEMRFGSNVRFKKTIQIVPAIEYVNTTYEASHSYAWTFRMIFDWVRSPADYEKAVNQLVDRHQEIGRAMGLLHQLFGEGNGYHFALLEEILLSTEQCICDQTGAAIYFSKPASRPVKSTSGISYGGHVFNENVEQRAIYVAFKNILVWHIEQGVDPQSIADALPTAQLGPVTVNHLGEWHQEAQLTLGGKEVDAVVKGTAGQLSVVLMDCRDVVPLQYDPRDLAYECPAPFSSAFELNASFFDVDVAVFSLMTMHGFIPAPPANLVTPVADTGGIFA